MIVILWTVGVHNRTYLRRCGNNVAAWNLFTPPVAPTRRTVASTFHRRTLPRLFSSSSSNKAAAPEISSTSSISNDDKPTTTTPTASPVSMAIPLVVLRRNVQSRSFRDGNPLIFRKSVTQAAPSLRTGDVVHVCVELKSASEKANVEKKIVLRGTIPNSPIGFGIYNAHSLYAIRLLCHATLQPTLYKRICQYIKENDATAAEDVLYMLLQHQVRAAIRVRRTLGCTDTFRLLNGEGDTLSGLAVDVIGGNHLVVMSSAAWCQQYRGLIEYVLRQEYTPPSSEEIHVIWKTAPSRLAQDGYFPNATAETMLPRHEHELVDDDSVVGEPQGDADHTMVLSTENGILYETYPTADGQKTGVYSDQRHNRFMMASHCRDRRVLDLCCYTGGFSLNALIHGPATHCTAVDSSPVAIAAATANAQRNQIDPERISFQQADVTTFLQQSIQKKEYYDVVILDPPKLAPKVQLLEKATRKYHALNRDAAAVVSPTTGGLLLTCTCSAAMTQAEGGQYFLRMVSTAAQAAGRQVTLLSVHGAAPCHTQSPMAFPASSYLTAALFFVHPKGDNEVTR
jgi:23S rRNA G2069 N7-methylase RlmK/C1962 C5-methylase RlmI